MLKPLWCTYTIEPDALAEEHARANKELRDLRASTEIRAKTSIETVIVALLTDNEASAAISGANADEDHHQRTTSIG
ncbi:hypothetical protein L3X38_018978 [Prunus dulcis]|uniref:Uncharacterized protein n=1 Tax=Prunus dulcis TaxID=3755 RepID=A0AAD4WCM6_PRUDU|nr:hypothetical protein L3X38_018978 [Prunus dulcis]